MVKLVYVSGDGESVNFGIKEEYHVNIAVDVLGLNDIENNIYTNENKYGTSFLGFSTKTKSIKIKGYIVERDTYLLRKKIRCLNKVMYPQGEGRLYYMDGNYIRYIPCVAEAAPIYTRETLLTSFIINLNCLSYCWQDRYYTSSLVAGWINAFEFPIICEDYIEFATKQNSQIINIENKGDVESFIVIKIIAKGAINTPEIRNINTDEIMKINQSLNYGDEIHINTESGKRSIRLIKNGVTTNILNKLYVGSSFLNLYSGDNQFRYSAASGMNNMEIIILHKNKYLSV